VCCGEACAACGVQRGLRGAGCVLYVVRHAVHVLYVVRHAVHVR